MLTLGQAAKEAGISKPTLSKAIKSGRISATKQEDGSFSIDPAELFRVYPRNSLPLAEDLQQETHNETSVLNNKINVLEQLLHQVKNERDDLREQRDDLRAERDKLLNVIQEQAGAVKQLTHQPEQQPTPAKINKTSWKIGALVLLAAATVAGVIAWFWPFLMSVRQ